MPQDLSADQPKVMVSLQDLGILAAKAERNGTLHAFPEVALQWAEAAQCRLDAQAAEIARLQNEVARAVEAERERCARLCEQISKQYRDTGHGHAAERAANAIRAQAHGRTPGSEID